MMPYGDLPVQFEFESPTARGVNEDHSGRLESAEIKCLQAVVSSLPLCYTPPDAPWGASRKRATGKEVGRYVSFWDFLVDLVVSLGVAVRHVLPVLRPTNIPLDLRQRAGGNRGRWQGARRSDAEGEAPEVASLFLPIREVNTWSPLLRDESRS